MRSGRGEVIEDLFLAEKRVSNGAAGWSSESRRRERKKGANGWPGDGPSMERKKTLLVLTAS